MASLLLRCAALEEVTRRLLLVMQLAILDADVRPVVVGIVADVGIVVAAILEEVEEILWPLDRTRASFFELRGCKLITGLTGFMGPVWEELRWRCWKPEEPLWLVRGDMEETCCWWLVVPAPPGDEAQE